MPEGRSCWTVRTHLDCVLAHPSKRLHHLAWVTVLSVLALVVCDILSGDVVVVVTDGLLSERG